MRGFDGGGADGGKHEGRRKYFSLNDIMLTALTKGEKRRRRYRKKNDRRMTVSTRISGVDDDNLEMRYPSVTLAKRKTRALNSAWERDTDLIQWT